MEAASSSVVQRLLQWEAQLVETWSWPAWALRLLASLSLLVLVTALVEQLITGREATGTTGNTTKGKREMTWSFRYFQLQYLSVYLLTMLADWLQGTNMYTLYVSYGVDVGMLFLTGFLSSAVFGTFLGIYVDRWGRKFGCIVFCLLEIVINLLEHLPNMSLLLVGRVLGGLSTSLLFSAFESWMVAEHRRRGFPEEWLASSFSLSAAGNGLTAILAGFLAQISADYAGDIGPFQVAIALTIITLALIFPWRENYGSDHCEETAENGERGSSLWKSLCESSQMIAKHKGILYLGLSQACFEGAVFTFVFMWVPALLSVSSSPLPTGLVFSSFMLAMTLGGLLCSLALSLSVSPDLLCVLVFVIAAAAMSVPLFAFDFWSLLMSFLVLETAVGVFQGCGATLRSRYYPDARQSSLISVFRLPLNLLVVCGTRLANNAQDTAGLQRVFGVVAVMHVIAAFCQNLAWFYGPPTDVQIHFEADSEKEKKNQ